VEVSENKNNPISTVKIECWKERLDEFEMDTEKL